MPNVINHEDAGNSGGLVYMNIQPRMTYCKNDMLKTNVLLWTTLTLNMPWHTQTHICPNLSNWRQFSGYKHLMVSAVLKVATSSTVFRVVK